MGAGKTRTVLDGLRFLGDFKKLLVLGPPVVLDGWLRETRRVSGGAWKAVLWDGTPEAVEAARDAKVVVLSYARARIEANFDIPHPQLGTLQVFAPEKSRLLKLGYDVIVADESHNFGNPDSEQTKACLELSAGTARRYCLTGTPGDNPGKIYAQLHFLSPALLNMSWDKFKARYFIYSDTHQGVIGYTRLNELNAIVASISTRVKKADCDLDLPPLTVVDITFGLGPRQVLRYNEVVEDMRVTFRETMAGHLPVAQSNGFQLHNRAVAINKLLQIISGFVIEGTDTSICDACEHMEGCVENAIEPYTKKCQVVQKAPKMRVIRDMENPKLEVFKDLITQILESDPTNKVITWGIFKEELDAMQAVVHSLGVKSVRLDGKTTRRSGEVEDAINKDPSVRVLIGMMSAGVGLTLTTPNYMIYYSLPWLPLRYWQAMDRFNRPGQRRRMTVYRLLTSEGSDVVDRCVAGVLKFKDRVEATMVSRIACVQCNRMAACALDGTQPFRENCTYAAAVDRPITKVKTI
jgi:SNF2 family DNA or RNA helicase